MYINQDGIYMEYTLYIPDIYRKSGFQMKAAAPRAGSGGPFPLLPVSTVTGWASPGCLIIVRQT